ncbi:MAG: ABC transporter permease subunit [Clostridia bacterium]|nr:ABC transporter permease subunit [Clostridia bacterium]
MKLVFFKKEFLEFFRTYRFYVLFGVFIFFGLINAPTAKFLPEILKSMPDLGVSIEMPEPVLADSYVQYFSNATNAFFAMIIVFMGSFSSEIKKGTIYLVLSKGVPRLDFYFSKLLNAIVMYTAAFTAYTAVTVLGTIILFNEWHFDGILASILSIYVLGLLLVGAVLSASSVARSAGPGAFAGFGLVILLPLTDFLGKAAPYLPGRLMSLPGLIMSGASVPGDVVLPTLITLALMIAVITASCLVFYKREL